MLWLGLKKLKLYAFYNVVKYSTYITMFYTCCNKLLYTTVYNNRLQKPQLPPDANLMTFEEFKILDKERNTIYVIKISMV